MDTPTKTPEFDLDFGALLRERMEQELLTDGVTKRSALRTAFVWAINSGALKTGTRLPAETELAGIFGVSLGTVQAALGQVQDLGLIERRRGDGTRVLHGQSFGPEVWHFRMHDLLTGEPARILHQEIEVLQTDSKGPWVDHLGEVANFTVIRRAISVTGGIQVGAEMVLDAALVSAKIASPSELRLANLRTYLEQRLHVITSRVVHRVTYEKMDPRRAVLLGMAVDADVLKVEARTFLADGRAFYFQTIYVPANRVSLDF